MTEPVCYDLLSRTHTLNSASVILRDCFEVWPNLTPATIRTQRSVVGTDGRENIQCKAQMSQMLHYCLAAVWGESGGGGFPGGNVSHRAEPLDVITGERPRHLRSWSPGKGSAALCGRNGSAIPAVPGPLGDGGPQTVRAHLQRCLEEEEGDGQVTNRCR